MNTRQVVLAFCISSLAPLAFADDAHHPEDKTQAAPAKPAPKQPAMMMDMGAMQTNMKRMQEQMAQIRSNPDAKARERLMDEHMKTMQETMSLMDRMMEQHMGMMRMMMRQMIEHAAAEHSAPK